MALRVVRRGRRTVFELLSCAASADLWICFRYAPLLSLDRLHGCQSACQISGRCNGTWGGAIGNKSCKKMVTAEVTRHPGCALPKGSEPGPNEQLSSQAGMLDVSQV